MVRALSVLVVLIAACEQPEAREPTPLVPVPPVPKPAIAPAPAIPNVTGAVLRFDDRRGDLTLRHGGVMAVGVSRQGRFAASGSWTGTVAVWDTSDGHLVRWFNTPQGNIGALAVTDDGTRLATSGWDDTLRVWDVASGREVWQTKQSAAQLAFDATGTRLVGHRFDLYFVWNAADGRELWKDVDRDPYSHDGFKPERSHAIASDGSVAIELVVNGTRSERVGCVSYEAPTGHDAHFHDVATGTERKLRVGNGTTQLIEASPKADRIAVIDYDGILDVFASGGKHLARVRVAPTAQLPPRTHVMLTDDPRYAITSDQHEIAGYDLLANKEIWRERGELYRDPQLAGADVVVSSEGGACIARRLHDGARLWRRDQCLYVAASPASNIAVLVQGTSTLDIVDATTGTSRFVPTSASPTSTISELVISDDGKQVVGFAERSLWRWDSAGLHLLRNPGRGLWRPMLHFLSNGQLGVVDEVSLAAAVAYRYDIGKNTIESTHAITLGGQVGSGRAFVGDHVIVEKVLEDNYERTSLDLRDREPPRKLTMWKRPAHRPELVMRNDNLYQGVIDTVANRAYVDGDSNVIHAWDLKTGKLLAESTEHNGFTRALVLTPDRKHVIVPRELDSSQVLPLRQGQLVVLETSKLTKERELGPTGYPTAAAISPDGTLVVAAALDGLFVWQLADGQRVATVDFAQSHEAPTSLAFAPDGKSLWVGTDIGTLLHFTVAYSANRAP